MRCLVQAGERLARVASLPSLRPSSIWVKVNAPLDGVNDRPVLRRPVVREQRVLYGFRGLVLVVLLEYFLVSLPPRVCFLLRLLLLLLLQQRLKNLNLLLLLIVQLLDLLLSQLRLGESGDRLLNQLASSRLVVVSAAVQGDPLVVSCLEQGLRSGAQARAVRGGVDAGGGARGAAGGGARDALRQRSVAALQQENLLRLGGDWLTPRGHWFTF